MKLTNITVLTLMFRFEWHNALKPWTCRMGSNNISIIKFLNRFPYDLWILFMHTEIKFKAIIIKGTTGHDQPMLYNITGLKAFVSRLCMELLFNTWTNMSCIGLCKPFCIWYVAGVWLYKINTAAINNKK